MKKMNIVRQGAQKNRGFTLIELLVVIAIIGILSSVVLVSLNSARSKGKDARVQEEVNQIRTVLESNYLNGVYPDLTVNATASIAATSTANLNVLVTDIAGQNGGSSSVLNSTSGVSGSTWGVQILTTTGTVTYTPTDYAIYAETSAGYQCVDSYGGVVTNTAAGHPVVANGGHCK